MHNKYIVIFTKIYIFLGGEIMNLENISKDVMKEIKEKDIKGAASVVAAAAKYIAGDEKEREKLMNTAKDAVSEIKDKVGSLKK